MSESSSFKQQAKALLEGIFGILDSMVINTMDQQNPKQDSASDIQKQDLFSLRSRLKSVQDEFVDGPSVLNEVEVHLDQYKNKIQDIILSKPKPSPVPDEVKRTFQQIDDEE